MDRMVATPAPELPDVDAVTDAVLTASRLLVAVSLRSMGPVDDLLTLPQFRLMVVLHSRGQLNHRMLAEHLGVTPSTATRMVDRLVAVGMVVRSENPQSRREVLLDLTDEGRQVVRQVTNRRRREIAKIVARMPDDARRGMVEVLTAFTEAGGEPPAEGALDAVWT